MKKDVSRQAGWILRPRHPSAVGWGRPAVTPEQFDMYNAAEALADADVERMDVCTDVTYMGAVIRTEMAAKLRERPGWGWFLLTVGRQSDAKPEPITNIELQWAQTAYANIYEGPLVINGLAASLGGTPITAEQVPTFYPTPVDFDGSKGRMWYPELTVEA